MNADAMIILGIDPGVHRVGFGVLEVNLLKSKLHQIPKAVHWGVIETQSTEAHSVRLQEIFEDVTGLIAQVKPQIAMVESLFFFRNLTTVMPVAQARGVILLALQQAGVRLVEYTPMQVKLALAGHGKATKQEVTQAVVDRLKMEQRPKPDDAADGLALAMTGWLNGVHLL
jgi:crossover junction endodeoxyribonuclease RuvC